MLPAISAAAAGIDPATPLLWDMPNEYPATSLSGDGDPIDLAYRDYAVYDLVALGQKGVDVEPMRALFRQNRIISSITAAASWSRPSCR